MTYYKPGDTISKAVLVTTATMTGPNVIYFPMTYLKSIDKVNSATLTFLGFSRCYTDAVVNFKDTTKTYKADMVYKGYNTIFWRHRVDPEVNLPGRGVLYIELNNVNVTFS